MIKMNKKTILLAVGIFFLLLVPTALAADWTPFGDINLRGFYNITNFVGILNGTGSIDTLGSVYAYGFNGTWVNTTNLKADNLESNMDGTGFNITGNSFYGFLVNGTWLNTTNLVADNLESNMDATGYNITAIQEVAAVLIDTTNLEADNLESNLDGTGYNVTVYRLTATDLSATNLESDLDGTGYTITGGTLTDGTIQITGGDLTSADDVNATEFFQNGNKVIDSADIVKEKLVGTNLDGTDGLVNRNLTLSNTPTTINMIISAGGRFLSEDDEYNVTHVAAGSRVKFSVEMWNDTQIEVTYWT